MLIGAFLLLGFGPSMFHPPAVGSLSRRFADRRSFAISLHGTGGSIGEVLGPLVGAGLLAFLFWRNVLRVEFIPGIIAALFLLARLRDTGQADGHYHDSFGRYLGSLGSLLKQRSLLLILLVTACRSVGQSTTSIFLPIYLRESLHYSSGLVGVYIAMSQLAGIGSQPLMGQMSDRFGHKRVIMPALLAFALILALVPLADGKVPLAIAILALGFFVFSMQSILTSAAVAMAGHEVHSSVVSLIYASSFVGSLAPTVAGILSDAYGIKTTFYFSACLALVAAAILSATHLPHDKGLEVGGQMVD
jgi:MFS family permease